MLLVLVALFQLITLVLSLGSLNDMEIFRSAATALGEGRNIFLERYRDGYAYYYGVLFALFLGLFDGVPLAWMQLAWGLLQLLLLFRLHRVLEQWTGMDRRPLATRLWVHAVVALVLLQAVRDNLNACQTTILLCWCCVETLEQAHQGRYALAALILAFGIDMKLLPLVVVPYLVYRAQWRTLLWLPLFLAVLMTLPLPFIGTGAGQALLETRWQLLDPMQQQHLLDDEEPDFVSLGSLLSAYFGDGTVRDHEVGLPRRILALSPGHIGYLLLLARLVLVVGMLWFLRTWPFRFSRDDAHRTWEVGYLLACVPLIFPHQQNYSVFFLIVLLFHLAATRAISGCAVPRGVIVLAVVLFLAMNAHLLLGEFDWFYDHYKVLSLTMLGAMVWSACTRPVEVGSIPSVQAWSQEGNTSGTHTYA